MDEDAATNAGETVAVPGMSTDETAAVPAVPSPKGDLAWSDSQEDDGEPPSATTPWHSLTRWSVALAAVLVTGLTAAFFGVTLFRDKQIPVTMPSKSPVAAPTVALPPDDPVHAPAQYPWVAIAVGNDVRPGGKRAFGYGFGMTEDTATQTALTNCRAVDQNECTRQSAAANACIAIAVNPSGAYATSPGPNRSTAVATARSNLLHADRAQAFCSWDGNGAPATNTPGRS
jgi:hypothetical protein